MENLIQLQKKKKVIIVAMTGNTLLYLAGPTDVFFHANKYLQEAGIENGYEVLVVSPTTSKKVETETGIIIDCQYSAMDFNDEIDTLIIAGNDFGELSQAALQEFYSWLSTRNRENTRRIASICGGSFALAKAGMLDGRKATTHWYLAERMKKAYPNIKVNSNPFYINSDDGHIFTSAGVTTGIDLSIALVEHDFGKDIAIRVARKLVFYLNRPGLQSQFGSLVQEYESGHIAQKTQQWLTEHLHERLDVNQVAEYMNMSTRNFTRVFTKQTGVSPAKFIEKLRVEKARKYLENTDIPIERVAEHCGLGGLVSMRRIFLRHLMTTPSDYRRAFQSAKYPDMDHLTEIA
ncbi:transcriptional regulator GlxA family with amidase domain [Chryseobacterium ginsenosidimutans]|uniref:GlxA family transcriptional regulator n=1 Tax=Chryseobacterium ginsenosidimutans TaxID=687846 RepID=UPI002166EB6B|nr:helix-turn-helix domain-containing protein [Chryseobacterium ginsenosidimutans]MCS3869935.1 transcriptional regulator GlxA family with amidase domain [Chryseobacterium ginsenosidimutans]